MHNIVFYISGHGFGHATRSIAIIRELAKNNGIQIIIKTSSPLNFIKESLADYNNIDYLYSENDVGLILKKNSFIVDREKMQKEVNEWVNNWYNLIEKQIIYLQQNQIDLIISDITPWVFASAKEAGIRSIAISNFTWYDQYRELLIKDKAVEKVGEIYQDADLFLCYPLYLGLEKVDQYEEIGFFCREFNKEQAKTIKENMGGNKKLVFVGIGKSVDYNILNKIKFQDYKQYNWLFSAGTKVEGDNIYKIPEGITEAQNYIAASDYAITKAGWGTVSELVLSKVPMILINRREIPEDRAIIKGIKD